MTHSMEKRLGDIFSLSHSPRDSEERRGLGFFFFFSLQKLNLYTAVLNCLMYACLNETMTAALFSSAFSPFTASALCLEPSSHLR